MTTPRRTSVRWTVAALLVALAAAPSGAACDDPAADGDGDGDLDADVDGDADGDLGSDADGDSAADADADEEPPCPDPPGSACNPIPITTFPWSYDGDTSTAGEAVIDGYGCAPDIDESGPELHFEMVVGAPSTLRASVTESEGVDVDLHVLRSAAPDDCIARANTELVLPVAAGTYRLVVDTYSDGTILSGAFTLDVDIAEAAGEPLGIMWNTYYFLANEGDHEGPQDTPIYDADCALITNVREDFHDSVCIEGSGILDDGTVINYASTCTSSCPAARTCGSYSYRICYQVLDSDAYPWGMGAGSVALAPDRSIAVDPDFVALGTLIYLEELDGVVPPGASEPHDGCLRADDVGGAIDGNHFDFFSGTRDRWLAWEEIFPTHSNFSAWANHPRCFGM